MEFFDCIVGRGKRYRAKRGYYSAVDRHYRYGLIKSYIGLVLSDLWKALSRLVYLVCLEVCLYFLLVSPRWSSGQSACVTLHYLSINWVQALAIA